MQFCLQNGLQIELPRNPAVILPVQGETVQFNSNEQRIPAASGIISGTSGGTINVVVKNELTDETAPQYPGFRAKRKRKDTAPNPLTLEKEEVVT